MLAKYLCKGLLNGLVTKRHRYYHEVCERCGHRKGNLQLYFWVEE